MSLTLLAVGVYGLVTKRSGLKLLISLELVAAAAAMNFVGFAAAAQDTLGQAFMILALSVDTCIAGVVLAVLMALRRVHSIADLSKLPPEEESE
ncbi:MAG: NADH-quinone oxidoreductase subunit K [Aigarchaeota archaeon]|nr:NADH-quinone oxidoreductase subunit K [Aigarchaeota archaeon]